MVSCGDVDQIAATDGSPRPAPLIEPAEAIAIALSMLPRSSDRLCGPDSEEVTLVLQSIRLAGWTFAPR